MLRFAQNLLKFRAPSCPKYFFSRESKEVIDLRRREEKHNLIANHVNCLVIHPVKYPNKGAVKELYLAEEAVGLAKALDWKVLKGPLGKEESEIEADINEEGAEIPLEKGKKKLSKEEEELFDEWKNEFLRNSIAKTSLLRIRQPTANYLFGKGKVDEIGEYIHENDINAVFINTELTAIQIRNLEKIWNQRDFSRTTEENDMLDSDEDFKDDHEKRIKVFDRFTMILQIFAKRAKTRIAKLQIELAFLSFLKSKLTREGTTFSGMYSIFSGDLMSAEEIKLEVVSSKQRGALGKMAGEGETQLEIERRVISDKEAKIKRELLSETTNRQKIRTKRKLSLGAIPTVALIGYTNAGKSALMNKLTKAGVESENKLFQTLSTTSKKLKLNSGQMGMLLDTIGFITNLPHDLVESFKCTLEEVEDADIVLHVRDISHPNTEDQKETVLQVLKEIGFDENFYTKKMIEVWNKIDLVEEPINYKEVALSNTPIVPISALYGTNCDKLIELVTTKINEVTGKKKIVLESSPEKYSERINWLYKIANIAEVESFTFTQHPTKDFPYGKITFEVYLDDVTYKRYEATFGDKGGKRERDKVPDDWMQSSKSFFERRVEEKAREREKENKKLLGDSQNNKRED